MESKNYWLLLSLFAFANVNEDFLIDYDEDIQAIIDKMDAFDLISSKYGMVVGEDEECSLTLCIKDVGSKKNITEKELRMFKRIFKREHENNAKDTDN